MTKKNWPRHVAGATALAVFIHVSHFTTNAGFVQNGFRDMRWGRRNG